MDNIKNILTDRFGRYVKIDTTAVDGAKSLPSSNGQHILADLLTAELNELGYYTNVYKDSTSTVFATLQATQAGAPSIGFIVHLDTAPGTSGKTQLQTHKNYSGGNILLNKELNVWLKVSDFPELENYIGDDIFTSDGISLLGADDKAAIAEVLTGIDLIKQNRIPHGEIKLVFVPDEEIGLKGAKALDINQFKVDFAYALDCCGIGEYVVENWNAGCATVKLKGQTAHPMSAKGKMRNALIMAHQLISLLPAQERPENSEKKEGYYWVKNLTGDTAHAEMIIDIREFDDNKYIERKQFLKECVESINKSYQAEFVELEISDIYPNIAKTITSEPRLINLIIKAMTHLNIAPKALNMRGGFDGAAIADKGIPCGNFFTGAHNFHSIYEFLPMNSMIAATQVVYEIVKLAAENDINNQD